MVPELESLFVLFAKYFFTVPSGNLSKSLLLGEPFVHLVHQSLKTCGQTQCLSSVYQAWPSYCIIDQLYLTWTDSLRTLKQVYNFNILVIGYKTTTIHGKRLQTSEHDGFYQEAFH